MDTLEDQGKSSLLDDRVNKHIREALLSTDCLRSSGVHNKPSYQLLGDPLHQCGEIDVITLPVVEHVLHQLGDGLCISLGLKLVAFALLWKRSGIVIHV